MGRCRRWSWVVLIFSLGPACLGGGKNNKPPATAPAAPTGLSVLAVTTARIDLSWIDPANNEYEYRIERSDDGGLTYAQIGTAPQNTLAYSDLGLLPDTTYYYRVAAWNSKGYSPYAGPASTLTKKLKWLLVPSGVNDPTVGRGSHSAIFDAIGNRMIVFGGWDDLFNVKDEVWSFDLSMSTTSIPAEPWALKTTGGIAAPFRLGHSAVYDSVHRRMIVFGGQDDVLSYSNLVYVLDLATLTWSQPAVTGTPPAPRALHTAVYDSANQQMIVYGGNDGTNELDDLHVLSFPTSTSFVWSTPSMGARPVGRSEHASIYDPVAGRMVVFAGFDQEAILDGSGLNEETWTFASSWTNLTFPGIPGFRRGHSAVYDAANRRMVTYSGAIDVTPTLTNETWSLKLDGTPAWSLLNPSIGSPPPGRIGHSAIYDSAFNRMVIYGGMDDLLTAFNDVWIVDL